jgi:hypothetical protein
MKRNVIYLACILLLSFVVLPIIKEYNDPSKNALIPSSTEYEIVKEYRWAKSPYYHHDLVIKNTSGYDAYIEVTASFYDIDGNLLGVYSTDEMACENGYETFWPLYIEFSFDCVKCSIKMIPNNNNKGVQSIIALSSNIVKNKVNISAKNTGNRPVKSLKYYLLFLDENKNVVDCNKGFFLRIFEELKQGETTFVEETSSEEFVDVELYTIGI